MYFVAEFCNFERFWSNSEKKVFVVRHAVIILAGEKKSNIFGFFVLLLIILQKPELKRKLPENAPVWEK